MDDMTDDSSDDERGQLAEGRRTSAAAEAIAGVGPDATNQESYNRLHRLHRVRRQKKGKHIRCPGGERARDDKRRTSAIIRVKISSRE
jgi:hypothetical protein